MNRDYIIIIIIIIIATYVVYTACDILYCTREFVESIYNNNDIIIYNMYIHISSIFSLSVFSPNECRCASEKINKTHECPSYYIMRVCT